MIGLGSDKNENVIYEQPHIISKFQTEMETMFQTCFMFTRFALWPRLLYLFHHMLASNSYLVLSGSEEKKIQIIIHNPIWNITWTWGALVRANAEGEFQGLVLRSNQEESFFFQERNLRTRQWKEALLVLGLSEEPGERERDFFQDKNMSKYVFKSRTWCLGDFQTPPVQTSMRSPRLTRRASGLSGRRGIGVQDPFNLACSPFVRLRHKKVKLL